MNEGVVEGGEEVANSECFTANRRGGGGGGGGGGFCCKNNETKWRMQKWSNVAAGKELARIVADMASTASAATTKVVSVRMGREVQIMKRLKRSFTFSHIASVTWKTVLMT